MADGFNTGPSTSGFSWTALEPQRLPDDQELRQRGRDVILLGFDERKRVDPLQRPGRRGRHHPGHRGARGGNRWPSADSAWAAWSPATPWPRWSTRGRTIRRGSTGPTTARTGAPGSRSPSRPSRTTHDPRRPLLQPDQQPAAQELLWQHITEWDSPHEESKLRLDFLAALEQVGGWPRRPRLIGRG